jgi:hypothetical protein
LAKSENMLNICTVLPGEITLAYKCTPAGAIIIIIKLCEIEKTACPWNSFSQLFHVENGLVIFVI